MLVRAESENGYINAASYQEGYALSEPKLVDPFTKITSAFMSTRCNSISSKKAGHESSVDTLKTLQPLDIGDKIYIVKTDNTIIEKTLTESPTPTVVQDVILQPTDLTSNTSNDNFTLIGASYGYKIFDGDLLTSVSSGSLPILETKIPFAAQKIGIYLDTENRNTSIAKISASQDNITYDTLRDDFTDLVNALAPNPTYLLVDFDYLNTTPYKYYKIEITANLSYPVYSLDYLADQTIYTIDTTTETQGETPIRTYFSKETLQLNDYVCTQNSLVTQLAVEEAGTIEQDLWVNREYQDFNVSPTPTEIVTKIGVSVPSNDVTYVSYETR